MAKHLEQRLKNRKAPRVSPRNKRKAGAFSGRFIG